MKNFKRSALIVVFLVILIIPNSNCSSSKSSEIIFIENGKIKLGFEKASGKFIFFSDLNSSYEFINSNVVKGLPWEIKFHSSSDELFQINEIIQYKFDYSKPDPLTLILRWENFKGKKNLIIKAKITLDADKALSYWGIETEGTYGQPIESLIFPKIEGIRDMENEELAFARGMGSLIKEPRKILSEGRGIVNWVYPGTLSSQVVALYNSDKNGFYASCNDSLSYAKRFSFKIDTLNTLVYEMINYPVFDSSLASYSPSYEAVIGSFKGDWITVAGIYGEWAEKQKWVKESRFSKGLTPSWLDSTALWVWNRGRSDNVLKPAIELKHKLGLPVVVSWHWWHNCSYDDNFPEYFPPREGKESFIHAVSAAQKEGVRSIVYMNSIKWGDSSASWKTENAEPYSVKDINGNMNSHMYNIFTRNSLTNMCIATDFWINKYSLLCKSAVDVYQINGVYMDQACVTRMCYDPHHGHSIGGGNYWVKNFGKLTNQIRSKIADKTEPVFTGEGSGENWIPYLDAFLTLEVSRERYSTDRSIEPIPFFQAVYHEYAVTYGSYSSLVTPPYDELWPEEHAPDETEQPLDEKFNKQFLMEQARSFVWGMQPTIANYQSFLATERKDEIDYLLNIVRLRYTGLKYLLYGKFLRTPHIEIPVDEIDISRLSIYAGRRGKTVTSFKKSVPLLYSGAWKADDGDVGITLASISDKAIPIEFQLHSKNFDLPVNGKVYIRTNEERKLLNSYSEGLIKINISLPPKGICIIEITP